MKKSIQELDSNFKTTALSSSLKWFSGTDTRFQIEGMGWPASKENPYVRLPLKAKRLVREPVWLLAQCPSSIHIRFITNSPNIGVRLQNKNPQDFSHMAGTGQCGVALYKHTPQGLRPLSTTRPPINSSFVEAELYKSKNTILTEYSLYLPLYQPVQSIAIGLSKNAKIIRPKPYDKKKGFVFYGTSITQGGCASTTGSDFVSTIGRLTHRSVINLGFSGNGFGEPEIARLMTEIPAALYVVDNGANVSPEGQEQTLPEFVRILRAKHPTTPILLVSRVLFWPMQWDTAERSKHEKLRDGLMRFYLNCKAGGDTNIFWADGNGLIPYGSDGAFVDGVHPTDYGFRLMANALSAIIDNILQ